MADIAKADGVSKGTLYVYFKDKDELLFSRHHSFLRRRSINPDLAYSKGCWGSWTACVRQACGYLCATGGVYTQLDGCTVGADCSVASESRRRKMQLN